jgi:hypothetical protein
VHIVKGQGEMEIWIHAFLPSALDVKALTSLIKNPYLYYCQHEENKNARENTQILGKKNGTVTDMSGFGLL